MRLKLEDFESNYFKFSNLLSVQVSHFLAVFFFNAPLYYHNGLQNGAQNGRGDSW